MHTMGWVIDWVKTNKLNEITSQQCQWKMNCYTGAF